MRRGRGGARAAGGAGGRRRRHPASHGVPAGINDSKKLTEKTRARLCAEIRACAVVGVGVVHPEEIDRLNIYWATMKAMTLAVDAATQTLGCHPAHVLVDGNKLPKWDYSATAIVGAMPSR